MPIQFSSFTHHKQIVGHLKDLLLSLAVPSQILVDALLAQMRPDYTSRHARNGVRVASQRYRILDCSPEHVIRLKQKWVRKESVKIQISVLLFRVCRFGLWESRIWRSERTWTPKSRCPNNRSLGRRNHRRASSLKAPGSFPVFFDSLLTLRSLS